MLNDSRAEMEAKRKAEEEAEKKRQLELEKAQKVEEEKEKARLEKDKEEKAKQEAILEQQRRDHELATRLAQEIQQQNSGGSKQSAVASVVTEESPSATPLKPALQRCVLKRQYQYLAQYFRIPKNQGGYI